MTSFPHDPEARKRALIAEFEQTIAPQKHEIARSLPQLWKQCYDPPPVASIVPTPIISPAPSMGNTPSFGMPSAKRPKTHTRDPAYLKLDNVWRACGGIVSKLWKRKEAKSFHHPVDPIALGIPDYPKTIREPMDLGTVKDKLHKRVYRTPVAFKADSSTLIHKDGLKMANAFDKMWVESLVEEMWQEAQMEADPGYAALEAIESQIVALELGSKLNRMVSGTAVAAPSAPGRDMSFIEKRKLSIALSHLPPSKLQLQMVPNILAGEPSNHVGQEVEFDLDMLSSKTLFRLRDLADDGSLKPAVQHRPVMAEKTARRSNGHMPAESDGQQTESDSEHSPRDVKGSTMDDPHGPSVFVKDRQMVDESATNPREQPTFIKDKADRKTDLPINTAYFTLATDGGGAGGAGDGEEGGGGVEGEGDEMWKSFMSIAEQKKQREEEQRRREDDQREGQERIERERKEAAAKLQREEEERQRLLREEEERQQQEQQRAREEQMKRELAEITSKAGTANLTQQSDMSILVGRMEGPTDNSGLEAVGLTYKNDEDEGFDFDD
eukprot:gene22136-29198_t